MQKKQKLVKNRKNDVFKINENCKKDTCSQLYVFLELVHRFVKKKVFEIGNQHRKTSPFSAVKWQNCAGLNWSHFK